MDVAATLPARSGRRVHVAVGGQDVAIGAVPPPWTERRARRRRLQDLAVAEARQAAAGATLCALCALGVALLLVPTRAAVLLWVAVTAVLWIAWAVRPPRMLGPAQQPCRGAGHRAFVVLTTLCLLLLSVMAWLPMAEAQRRLLGLVLALVAVSVAGALAPLGVMALLALLLPVSAALGQVWHAQGHPGRIAGALTLAVLWSGALGWLAARRRRHWRAEAAARLEHEDRLRTLAAERDEALRADADKTRFLANASHDLRQPVHAIGLFAATLEKRLRGTGDEPYVRNLIHSIDALERSFSAMLDLTRLDAGSIEPNVQHFPLRDLFRRLHMQFAGQAELSGLNLRFAPGGKWVYSDPQLLERLLANLIQNALKYTERGGVVVVARSTATRINIEVWDTGVGIGAAELPRVFDEFYQVGRNDRTRAQGLGMGLAIVKRLAQLLGHELSVASQPGRGTMFRVGVARGALDAVAQATLAADTLPMPEAVSRTVLVIEDEAPIREGLRELLQAWGHTAVVAASAREAEVAQAALRQPPDLILSDLHLGEGPDGIAAIAAVRRHWRCDVPALLVTGDTTHQELRRATDGGFQVLVKPVSARKLMGVLSGLGP
ncbi:hybrid sensor histidine kinase/response regulator [Azohydromonas caseinilytica]|uniref:histidine kinase n=1 Tax=Azohydromonas caseinilytica TaxID=2728836 RepID=A0A848FCP8_9BURK|nr:ATP-binding protein [Azohydromonas caseinilytica]NML16555.1 hybrid sensor histidine kinase/response regulator [Azohydromonas caseinilytica]